MLLQLLQRTLEQQPAVVQDAHLIHHLLDLAQQVAGDQQGGSGALRHGSNQTAHLLNARRVQTVGGFVQDQQFGAAQQRHGNAQPLLHAKGILPHLPVSVFGQVHDLQHPADVLPVYVFQVSHDGKVFPGGQVQVTGGGFDQAAGLPQQGNAVCFVQGAPQQFHTAAGGVYKPQQHLHGGGFARTVGA